MSYLSLISLGGLVFLLAVVLIFVGFLILLFYAFLKRKEQPYSKTEGGIFVLIGPLPIVIASNKKLAYALLIVGIIVAITFLALIWWTSYFF
jgi:uncharacterized membrane protein